MTPAALPASAYARAERMLGHHRPRLALRADVRPSWIRGGAAFWYRVDTERGQEFMLVDPEAGQRGPAFDHDRLAAALAAATARPIEPYDLPFRSIELTDRTITFDAVDAQWAVDLASFTCTRTADRPRSEARSPDGKWAAVRRGHDLWLRSIDDDQQFALTDDGTADRPYASHPDCVGLRQLLRAAGGGELPLVVAWSADSSRILTHRLDQSEVGEMHLVESSPDDGGRPRLHRYRYPMPGERLPLGEWLIFDVATRVRVAARDEPFQLAYLSPLKTGWAWWSTDGETAYHLDRSRGQHSLWLKAIDARTGNVRTLVEETGDTRVEPGQYLGNPPLVRVFAGGQEALWYSQRDGWGHLYLYDLRSGRLSGQVTAGEFAVQEIVHVDEAERVAYLLVAGLVPSDPYCRSLVSVPLDGGGPTRLTDDDLDHAVVAAPHGRWFVDSASTAGIAPVTTVRGRDGSVLLEVERADVSRLVAAGWAPPERVRTIAADGTTPIYGLLYMPHGFDPDQRYPVIDHPYPGPHTTRVQAGFDAGWYGYDAEAVAALGFAVLVVDGRGTPGRDKAFHDHSYGNIGSAGGLDDHVAAMRQLARTRPWLDLDRVGIFGLSAGGFAAVRAMLTFPDVYKVGVAEAGNHDNRIYLASWVEAYNGPYDTHEIDATARLSNAEIADQLRGKLLLVHGEMDDNVTSHQTMRLVDRLIAANRDFDLLVVPGAEHTFTGYLPYVTRRRWDYLVRHLMEREPPQYRLGDIPLHPDVRAVLFG